MKVFYLILRKIKWMIIFPILRKKIRKNKLNQLLLKEFGGKNINTETLLKYKKSDTLFILASGQSINNLSSANFDIIKKHDSIGINGFAYHSFVPTFHSFELENQHMPNALKMFKETSRNIIRKIEEYRNTAIIFRQHKVIDSELKEFVKKIVYYKNMYWNVYDVIPGNTIEEYASYLRYYKQIGLLKKDDFFPNKGSSLSWVISMAYKLKYKNIILCGVDLFGDHFYKNPTPMDKNQFEEKAKTLHLTGDKSVNNRITIQEIVELWQKEYFGPEGAQLYVGSEYSLLSKIIPVYWKTI